MTTTVSQEAREAAASCVSNRKAKHEIIAGVWDESSTVQAFAKFEQSIRQQAERGEVVARYRHKKRGTVYEVLGEGTLQCAANPLLDEQPVMIYRGEDGKLWVRGIVEFHDGRFEALPTPPEAVRTPIEGTSHAD